MVTAATSTEMTLLMLASVSASLAVFYWRDWQKAIVRNRGDQNGRSRKTCGKGISRTKMRA